MTTIVDKHADRETTIIVTADHGENHGTEVDEGLANHKSSLSEGLLHVPFYLINPPDGYRAEEGQFFSHLSLPTLIHGIANGDSPDVFSERIPAELVGMSPGPDPEVDIGSDYWDRMIRCGYLDSTKIVWDSLDTVTEYQLDTETANWQGEGEHLPELPAWARELFDTPIVNYKKQARQKGRTVSVDSSTEDRLADLGYL